jgi:hypothetical protein
MKRIALTVLLMTVAAFAQDRYSSSGIGQMEASESLNMKSGPASQHTLGETASHFAAAEPGVVDKKSHLALCLNADNKRKHCAEILQDGNGIVRFINGGVMSEETSGTSVYHFYTAYKFDKSVLVEIGICTGNDFSQVVDDFSARYGKPAKTWSENAQNAMGAKFDLGNASWEVPDGHALVTESVVFIVPPTWANRDGKMPKGYVHMTNAVIVSAAELAKAPSSEHHVKF